MSAKHGKRTALLALVMLLIAIAIFVLFHVVMAIDLTGEPDRVIMALDGVALMILWITYLNRELVMLWDAIVNRVRRRDGRPMSNIDIHLGFREIAVVMGPLVASLLMVWAVTQGLKTH